MTTWRCPQCGYERDGRCKPKKCPTCDQQVPFEKAGKQETKEKK
jgi:rubrerythrin